MNELLPNEEEVNAVQTNVARQEHEEKERLNFGSRSLKDSFFAMLQSQDFNVYDKIRDAAKELLNARYAKPSQKRELVEILIKVVELRSPKYSDDLVKVVRDVWDKNNKIGWWERIKRLFSYGQWVSKSPKALAKQVVAVLENKPAETMPAAPGKRAGTGTGTGTGTGEGDIKLALGGDAKKAGAEKNASRPASPLSGEKLGEPGTPSRGSLEEPRNGRTTPDAIIDSDGETSPRPKSVPVPFDWEQIR